MKSYDYAHRKGVEPIDWEGFVSLYRSVAEQLATEKVEAVIGIARAGLFAATAVAYSLRIMLYPVSVSRRVDDQVRFERPVWRVDVSPEVRGRVVAVIDEIADTGETLALVAQRALELGARRAVTASLVRHSWANPVPDVCPHVTDALVIMPWDNSIYVQGSWQLHPETVAALEINQPPHPIEDKP